MYAHFRNRKISIKQTFNFYKYHSKYEYLFRFTINKVCEVVSMRIYKGPD